jgi:GNAT superfamily N-acetyltransferase
MIIPARPNDLPRLPAIELAAARMLTGHAPQSVLDETTSQRELSELQQRGHLWVVLAGDTPVGFTYVKLLEPNVTHLDEIDVHPDHGRRGLGRRLVTTVCEWAIDAGHRAVTLRTFRDVRWNMPFYARLGFAVVRAEEVSPALRPVIDDERRRGLDPMRRVTMRRPLP